jgi:hypothetical protein
MQKLRLPNHPCCYILTVPLYSRSPHHVIKSAVTRHRHGVHIHLPCKVTTWRSTASGFPEQKTVLRQLPPESRVWGVKSATCLVLRLDPTNVNHKPVACNNCPVFCETKLKYDLTKYTKQKISTRLLCKWPFGYCGDVEEGKAHVWDWMNSLLSGDSGVSASNAT